MPKALTSRHWFWCAAALAVLAGIAHAGAPAATQSAAKKPVRLAIVNTPHFSGLIGDLIEDFQKSSGLEVQVYGGSDVYERARAGEADIVISHYGKAGVEAFVLEGYGTWPKMVFSNQLVIAGPKSDPAGIRGLASATEALRRIATARAPFIPNALPGIMYLTDILWEEAGKPAKDGWFLPAEEMKGRAVALAEEKGGYVIWGALPFLRYTSNHTSEMQIMVSADPILQRVMGIVRVRPEKVPGVNVDGAAAFEAYLLTPAAQARVAAFRSPGVPDQLWWPAGRNNGFDGSDE